MRVVTVCGMGFGTSLMLLMSIKEIGTNVGYASAQEFNKRFHQIAGLSPSAYRERLLLK